MTYEAARTARRFDLVFIGLFPWLVPLYDERRTLRPHATAPVPELAAEAEASALARQAPAREGAGAGGASAEDRLERWARLLARMLRARMEAEQQDAAYYFLQAPREAVFPLTAHLLAVHLADRPFPALLPALPVAAATHDLTGLHRTPSAVLDSVRAAMDDWTTAGVLAPAAEGTGEGTGERISAVDLVRAFWRDDDASGDPVTAADRFLRRIPGPVLDLIHGSPLVRLTPLGAYGIRRLLLAHNWTISPSP
ncbi:hypothetical protein [Nonomuraea sp. NPDC050783]|uniref:hypothetical protein n=1 Tax=Nonomuraea sp. NPDC050783 TaxID=3154634 RepID=UPI0034667809